jgi:hypothetical protein
MLNVLDPHPNVLSTFRGLMETAKNREARYAAEDSDGDLPMTRELRRRVIGTMEDLAELGAF